MVIQKDSDRKTMNSLYQKFFIEALDDAALYFDNNRLYTAQDFKEKIYEIYTHIINRPDVLRVAICTNNRYLFTAAFFAILYAKKTPVILGHSKEKLLDEQKSLFDIVLSDQDLNIASEIINLSNMLFVTDESLDSLFFQKNITQQEVILMTSGSSSEPSKIVKSIDYLEKETLLLIEQWRSNFNGSMILSTVSPMHQYGLTFNILLPLMCRSIIYVEQIFYQEEFARFDQSNRYVLITSPAFLKRLDLSLENQLNIKLAFSAGGALGHKAITDCINHLKAKPIEIYGSSETGVIGFNAHTLPVKMAFQPFNSIKISQYEDGTIKIDSPLFDVMDEVHLNDRINILKNNHFEILGRVDKIIKIEEKRISLTEIETRVKDYLNIDQVYTCVLSNEQRDIIGCVIVQEVLQEDERAIITALGKYLRKYIEPIAVPKRWRFIKESPINAQGKISTLELRELFDD